MPGPSAIDGADHPVSCREMTILEALPVECMSDFVGPDGDTSGDDPVFELPTFASGAGDVSANVDEYVANTLAAESDSNR